MEWIATKLIFLATVVFAMTGAFRGTHLKAFDLVWGPHYIDHFAYYLNTKLLRFNSRARKELNHLFMDWEGDNHFVCPPVCLIPRV